MLTVPSIACGSVGPSRAFGIGAALSPFFVFLGASVTKMGILSPFFVNYVVKITTICQVVMFIFRVFR